MRKRITLQDKKILIYEIHQGWAREHLEKLSYELAEFFSIVNPREDSKHLYDSTKENIRLQLRLLEITTREFQLPQSKKKKQKNPKNYMKC